MPVWLIILVIAIVVLGALWLVMERNPHHQFIDACGSDDHQKLLRLLERPQDLNKAGWFGLTPLGEAIRGKKIENVKALLSAGAMLTIPGARQSHLHTAVQEDAIEIARVLLESGADPSAKDYVGVSPLKIAGESTRVPMFKLLLEHGADPNGDDGVPGIVGEPLIVSLVARVSLRPKPEELNHLIEIVGLLLDKGANINARTQSNAPLIAIALPEIKMLRYLVDRGAITDVSWDGTDLNEVIATLLEASPN